MFDIGFPELMLVAVVMLLVLGPERLPEALRTAGLWFGRLQRNFQNVKTEIEREIGMDEIRRQLHNESVMAEMRKLEQDLKANSDPRFPGTGDMNSMLPEDSHNPAQNADRDADREIDQDLADAPEEDDAAARNAMTPHGEDVSYDDEAHHDPEPALTESAIAKPTETAGDEQRT